AAAAAGEDDVVGDDLGAIALLAVLLVRRGLDAPLDEEAGALLQDLGERVAALSPDRDRVPVGALLASVVPVEVALGGREAELQDRLATGGDAKLGVGPQVAEQHYFVQ